MTEPDRPELIERYTANQRTQHWIVAIAFVLAALSGLAMFHPSLFWLSHLFGGGPWTRILHPYIALVMAVAFVALAGRFWKDNRLEARDWAWLRQIKDVVNNREDRLPETGRYNAAQKLLFFVLVVCMAGLLLSGIVIWRAWFSQYFAVGAIRAAALLHALAAWVLVCAIIVHIYAALWVKGSMRAMTRGVVTPGWAWKHHRGWLREIRKH